MGSSYKIVQQRGAVSGMLEDAVAALVELGEECREAADNFASPDHPKAQAFGEAADALESVSLDVDLPEALASTEVAYDESRPKSKRRAPGRQVRCSNAVAMMEAALEAINEWLDDPANAEHEDRDEVEQLVTEVESIVSDAEGVEFPGMFG